MLLLALLIIMLTTIFVLSIWTYCKVSVGICKYSGHLVGKVVIVTGANSGIGFETAKDLAQRGARVILACRNSVRGTKAMEKIIESSENKDVHLLQLNMESFHSIRQFVDNINKTEKHLDILINNAGSYVTDNIKTEDGLLIGMQVNFFGPFLLTSLLLPLLKKTARSRIINVSSFLYNRARIDFSDLNMENGSFNRHKIYCNAKFCIILMTIELNRRLKGTGVTVNCLHPGIVRTKMMESLNIFLRIVLKLFQSFYKNPWEGAQSSIYLAVSPEVEKVSGKYFKDCHLAALNSKTQNLDIAKKLWEISEILVKLK